MRSTSFRSPLRDGYKCVNQIWVTIPGPGNSASVSDLPASTRRMSRFPPLGSALETRRAV